MSLLPFLRPASPGDRTVWVSRHGRTTGNEAQLVQGWGAYPLSGSGHADVSEARRWWAQRRVDWVITSPVLRAVQTAQVLFDRVDDIDTGWAEQSSPSLADMSIDDAHRAHPDLCRSDGWSRPDAPRSRRQEHIDTVTGRALGALVRAGGAVPAGRQVAVVTHGAVLVSLLRLTDGPGATVDAVINLAVAELIVDPTRGWQLVALHDPLAC